MRTGEEDATISDHSTMADRNLARADVVRGEQLRAGTEDYIVSDLEQLGIGAVDARTGPVDTLANFRTHQSEDDLRER